MYVVASIAAVKRRGMTRERERYGPESPTDRPNTRSRRAPSGEGAAANEKGLSNAGP